MDFGQWLQEVVIRMDDWKDSFGSYEVHPSLEVDEDRLSTAMAEFTKRLEGNYPFFHPRYVGQMLKPPHPAAMVAYLATMIINPNNHSLDGGPPSADMEKEAVVKLAEMFGIHGSLGHLATSGTLANMEALFIARELRPGQGIAHSVDAHYTHNRWCHVMDIQDYPIATDAAGRMDLDALEKELRTGKVGTVVVTAGTTGLGAIDPVHEVVKLKEHYDFRIHVDAAYGGFFTLIADDSVDGVASAPYRAISQCDSVVVDPHKHGLQPYGCGAVIYADPSVGRFFKHDSPYTYFTSHDLHLGEISLECSRAGASAAAFWLTLQLLPLSPDGLGAVLRPGRRAAVRWHEMLSSSEVLAPYQVPETDIVSYFPRADSLSRVESASDAVMNAGMHADPKDSVFVATYAIVADEMARRGHHLAQDQDRTRILRSVLMKPETDAWLDTIHTRLETLAKAELG